MTSSTFLSANESADERKRISHKTCPVPSHTLTVFNAPLDKTKIRLTLHRFIVYHANDSIPKHYHVKKDTTAFFIRGFTNANMFHFLRDFAITVMDLIMKSRENVTKASHMKMQLLTADPSVRCRDPRKADEPVKKNWLSPFVEAMGITINPTNQYSVHYEPIGTCFPKSYLAIGNDQSRGPVGILVKTILKHFKLDPKQCPWNAEDVIIMDRSYRRILNAKKLVGVAKQELNLTNPKVIDFERHSVRDQIKYAMCAKVLIGELQFVERTIIWMAYRKTDIPEKPIGTVSDKNCSLKISDIGKSKIGLSDIGK